MSWLIKFGCCGLALSTLALGQACAEAGRPEAPSRITYVCKPGGGDASFDIVLNDAARQVEKAGDGHIVRSQVDDRTASFEIELLPGLFQEAHLDRASGALYVGELSEYARCQMISNPSPSVATS